MKPEPLDLAHILHGQIQGPDSGRIKARLWPMSATIKDAAAAQRVGGQEVIVREGKPANSKNYKGFVAGVFSGIAKLSGEFYADPEMGCSLAVSFDNIYGTWLTFPPSQLDIHLTP